MQALETIRVLGRFHAAHRQLRHPGKCRFPHGHTWRGEIVLRADRFPRDELDMSIDFSALKDILKFLDHKILVTADDPEFADGDKWDPAGVVVVGGRAPSVENVTVYCLDQVWHLLESKYPSRGVHYEVEVTIQETDHNFFSISAARTI